MYLSSQKMYDSIDHMVDYGLYGTIFTTPQISAYICACNVNSIHYAHHVVAA